MTREGVSIIIPTANRPDDLKRVLHSIGRLRPSSLPYEVVVVDNSETFNAEAVVNSFEGLFPLRYVKESNQGLHYGRHSGYSNASYDILGYLDDDVILNVNWLEGVCKAFVELDADMATGDCIPMYESSPPNWFLSYWRHPRKDKRQNFGFWPYSIIRFNLKCGSKIDPSLVWGCNFIVRRDLISEYGGFHPDGLPKNRQFYRGDGESYIGAKAKEDERKAVYIDTLCVFHKVSSERLSREYLYQRGYNEGITQGYMAHRYERNSYLGVIRVVFVKKFTHLIKLFFVGREVREIFRSLDSGIRNGRRDYESEFFNSPELRSWVKQRNYW